MRIEELKQALIEIRNLPWVDQEQLFLMGISGSNSIVIKDAPHGMSDRPEVGKAVNDFLLTVTAE